jgi:exosortase
MKRIGPAWAVLLFLIPVPGSIRQEIAIPMQTASAWASQFVFELMALPVIRSGNVLVYNGQDVAIAEACNGMRMVFALLLVTYAFAFASPYRPSVRMLILLLSPVAAITCNIIRLVPTVYMYGHHPSIAPTFHDLAGWAMLGLAFLLLLGTISLLRWAEVPVMQDDVHHDPQNPGPPMTGRLNQAA